MCGSNKLQDTTHSVLQSSSSHSLLTKLYTNVEFMANPRVSVSKETKASESKREQFRRYLEKSGVLDTLTSVLVALYEESDKPNNALDFIKCHLGAALPEPANTEALHMEVAELKQKCNLLIVENKELRNRLMQYEPDSPSGAAE